MQSLDPATFQRYTRLSTHFILNKIDPMLLDELKFAFLEKAQGEDVSLNIATLRQIIKVVLNNERHTYEERVIQALIGSKDFDEENSKVCFEQVQKFIDVYDAIRSNLNESLADPKTYYTDPITAH